MSLPAELRVSPSLVMAMAFAAGALPFANVAAGLCAGVDLRHVGDGTVSGTGLHRVAGFTPLAAAGILDVGKGALGPLLAGPGRPYLGAVAASLAIAGHDWSPLLGGAGGRGVAPALVATMVLAPEATAVLLGGLVAGRLSRQTALVTLGSLAALTPLLWRRRGTIGLATAVAVAGPMIAKRLTGSRSPGPDRRRALRSRLLFDRDPRT
ncbi:MAG: glycerol-3-phosphate acyltransferase [Acidimicrobiales bacterium]